MFDVEEAAIGGVEEYEGVNSFINTRPPPVSPPLEEGWVERGLMERGLMERGLVGEGGLICWEEDVKEEEEAFRAADGEVWTCA